MLRSALNLRTWRRLTDTGLGHFAVAITPIAAAVMVVQILENFPVRDPAPLIYLAALAVSLWHGKRRYGLLSFLISIVCIAIHFAHLERAWLQVARYDSATLLLYSVFAWWLHSFTELRRHMEEVLKLHGEELDAAVKARTSELFTINAEYKSILDSAPFGIALFEKDRIVVRCNPEYERMLGCSPGELLGQHAPLPDDQKEAWKELESRLRQGQSVVDHQTPRLRHDGSRFPATIWLTPLRGRDGEYSGMVGFILDSTERNAREAERQMLATLVEYSPDLIAVTDAAGGLAFINGAGRRLLGLDRQTELAQINLVKRFHHHDEDSAARLWESATAKDSKFDIETVYKDPLLDRDIQLHCASFPIPPVEVGGSSLRAFVAQDITERKDAERRLRASLEENRKLLEENTALQEKLKHENISLQERNLALQTEIADIQRTRFERIVGESPALRRTLNKVEQVASTDVTVLITGETGTGKELIAQAIHENSKRAHMPFRAINCAAFPATLMASELFGHERGAFTGADRQRLGQFELASGGTLFLDEIGELPLETQAMLLRVLEEHTFERLGGTKPIRSDVRIIVATNRDLHTGMQKGEFRRDLFFRLSGFPIEVPALRERKGDIPHLVQHFVEVSAARHGKSIRNIEKRAMEMLLAYSWPGNIRELRNVIDTSVIVSPGEDLVVDEELLFGVESSTESGTGTLKEKMDQYERSLIEHALTESRGRVAGASGAATFLGLPPSTLSARMQALKIDVLKFKALPD